MLASIGWLIAFLVIGIVTIPLVRFLGPVGIRNYVLEELYDSQTGYYNIIYRVVSPALCCTALVSVLGIAVLAVGGPAPTACYLPLVFYWLSLGAMKIARKSMLSLLAFALEALVSIGIAMLFSQFVVRRILNYDFGFIDDSNIAFQAEMAVLAFLVQIIVSLFIRRQYRVNCCSSYSSESRRERRTTLNYSKPYYSHIDTSEKRLFEYERQYGSMLPDRFSSDPLLRCVFFSIMAIEDSNRPKGFRFLERIACTIGIAHSSGIMQQKSDRPLSDRESVELATGYIERMWDSFLMTFARSVQSGYSPSTFEFTSFWYRYNYANVAGAAEKAFGFFYGDYCGTRLLNASFVFSKVREFWERNRYGLLPRTVVSSWRTPPTEASWFSSGRVYWEDDYTVSCTVSPGDHSGYECITISGDSDQASYERIDELYRHIESCLGVVVKVTLIENVHVVILARCEVGRIDGASHGEWKIVRADSGNMDIFD